MSALAEARGIQPLLSFNALLLICLRSLNLEFAILAALAGQGVPGIHLFPFAGAGPTDSESRACFCMDGFSELSSGPSCFHGRHLPVRPSWPQSLYFLSSNFIDCKKQSSKELVGSAEAQLADPMHFTRRGIVCFFASVVKLLVSRDWLHKSLNCVRNNSNLQQPTILLTVVILGGLRRGSHSSVFLRT